MDRRDFLKALAAVPAAAFALRLAEPPPPVPPQFTGLNVAPVEPRTAYRFEDRFHVAGLGTYAQKPEGVPIRFS